jgi:hypothetical protein
MHIDFSITDMHCMEYNDYAFRRQTFNSPYKFIRLFPKSSTDYINNDEVYEEKGQIIWLDYASPKELRQQYKDIELLAVKLNEFDIVKFTFNANDRAFMSSHEELKRNRWVDLKKILEFVKKDATYQDYVPDQIKQKDILEDFSTLIRVMGMRAIKRGISKAGKEFKFNHIASFSYADGQLMTTMTGLICKEDKFKTILKESGLNNWDFYQAEPKSELINSNHITVPVMTVSERVTIDKLVPIKNPEELAKALSFSYGTSEDENLQLLEGYCKYYKYFPFYSKVSY